MAQQIRLGHEITKAQFDAIRHMAAIKAWDKRGRKGTEAYYAKRPHLKRPKAEPTGREDWAADKHAKREARLRTMKVVSTKRNHSGISETYQSEMEDGSKGNFKTARGERLSLRLDIEQGQQTEREVAAWEVAKIVGMDDMVAMAVARQVEVKTENEGASLEPGVMLEWQDGVPAVEYLPMRDAMGSIEEQHRAALFDFVIGNQDRHMGNWVVDSTGAVKLIDHGLSFGTGKYEPRGKFLDATVAGALGAGSTPIDQGLKDSYLKNRTRITSKLREIGLPEESVMQVRARLDRLDAQETWNELFYHSSVYHSSGGF